MTSDNGQKKCIVIGSRGFVGSSVVAEAKRRGFDVLDIDVHNYEHHRGASCDLLINANGNSKKFLGRENPALEFDLSVRSVQASLQHFKPAFYVHLSTIDVYSDVKNPANNREDSPIETEKLSPYGFHKLLAEQIVRYYAPQWLILRMGGFVGPGLRKNSIYDLLKGAPLYVHPDSAYQYQDSRFLASLAFELPARGCRGEIVNCAGNGLISVREAAAMIPGCKLPDTPTGSPERYEVNIAKLNSLLEVPRTRDNVSKFIADVLAGREILP